MLTESSVNTEENKSSAMFLEYSLKKNLCIIIKIHLLIAFHD